MSKRLRGLAVALAGLVTLTAVGLALVLMFGSQSGVPVAQQPYPAPTSVPSTVIPALPTTTGPEHSPTPVITKPPTTPGHSKPVGTPFPTPPPRTPARYQVRTSEDVVALVLNDPFFQGNSTESIFGAGAKDVVPSTPIFVWFIDEEIIKLGGYGYYLVPFLKEKRIRGIAVVSVNEEGITSGVSTWSSYDGEGCPPTSAREAQSLVEKRGYKVTDESRLVFRRLWENGAALTTPFWEIRTAGGETFYVIDTTNGVQVFKPSEVRPFPSH